MIHHSELKVGAILKLTNPAGCVVRVTSIYEYNDELLIVTTRPVGDNERRSVRLVQKDAVMYHHWDLANPLMRGLEEVCSW